MVSLRASACSTARSDHYPRSWDNATESRHADADQPRPVCAEPFDHADWLFELKFDGCRWDRRRPDWDGSKPLVFDYRRTALRSPLAVSRSAAARAFCSGTRRAIGERELLLRHPPRNGIAKVLAAQSRIPERVPSLNVKLLLGVNGTNRWFFDKAASF